MGAKTLRISGVFVAMLLAVSATACGTEGDAAPSETGASPRQSTMPGGAVTGSTPANAVPAPRPGRPCEPPTPDEYRSGIVAVIEGDIDPSAPVKGGGGEMLLPMQNVVVHHGSVPTAAQAILGRDRWDGDFPLVDKGRYVAMVIRTDDDHVATAHGAFGLYKVNPADDSVLRQCEVWTPGAEAIVSAPTSLPRKDLLALVD